jgi:hypothetical protein
MTSIPSRKKRKKKTEDLDLDLNVWNNKGVSADCRMRRSKKNMHTGSQLSSALIAEAPRLSLFFKHECSQ